MRQIIPISNRLTDILAAVEDNACVHWISEGDWMMHELLEGLLQRTGRANVYISSFTLSEYPALFIQRLKQQGAIGNLYCLLDTRLHKSTVREFLENSTVVYSLVVTHAKVTLIESEGLQVSIIGSAGYGTAKQCEAGVIVTGAQVFDYHKEWILSKLKNGGKA